MCSRIKLPSLLAHSFLTVILKLYHDGRQCLWIGISSSSVLGVVTGECRYKRGNGFHVVAAHADNPCPKFTLVSHSSNKSFLHVQVKTCGSGMWHTWFDRNLNVAGRVLLQRKDGELVHELVRVRRPILRIPFLPSLSERLNTFFLFKSYVVGHVVHNLQQRT
jgi:aspartyl aminopeptidase